MEIVEDPLDIEEKEITIKDIKKLYPNIDYGLNIENEHYDIIVRDRYERQINIQNKYVITKPSMKRGTLYVQDPIFSDKYTWSQFENNALVFNTKTEAKSYASQHNLYNTHIEKM